MCFSVKPAYSEPDLGSAQSPLLFSDILLPVSVINCTPTPPLFFPLFSGLFVLVYELFIVLCQILTDVDVILLFFKHVLGNLSSEHRSFFSVLLSSQVSNCRPQSSPLESVSSSKRLNATGPGGLWV